MRFYAFIANRRHSNSKLREIKLVEIQKEKRKGEIGLGTDLYGEKASSVNYSDSELISISSSSACCAVFSAYAVISCEHEICYILIHTIFACRLLTSLDSDDMNTSSFPRYSLIMSLKSCLIRFLSFGLSLLNAFFDFFGLPS